MKIQLDTRLVPEELLGQAGGLLTAAKEQLTQVRNGQCTGGEWTGWFDFPNKHGMALADDIQTFSQSVDLFYDTVVVVGIGGSYLGTRAVADSLSGSYQLCQSVDLSTSGIRPIIYAGHQLSEIGMVELLEFLEEREPILNVISKSGTTTEPSVAFRILRQYLERRYGTEASSRIVATTDPEKGALRSLAGQQGYRTFPVPPDVGGRYSVLSAVGLVPLALAGYDIKDMLAGADQVFAELRQDDVSAEHPVLRYAAVRQAAFAAGKRLEIMAYGEPKLFHLVEWWKQLFGESEGKEGKGLFPASLACTTDLHSLGQFVQDGTRNLLETFVEFAEYHSPNQNNIERRLRVPLDSSSEDGIGYLQGRYITEINDAAMTGTALAHADGGVPVMRLQVPRLDIHHLGQLFAFFETACAVSGLMLGVNPFDQPGVEDYKKNLFGLLGKPGFEELGQQLRQRLRP